MGASPSTNRDHSEVDPAVSLEKTTSNDKIFQKTYSSLNIPDVFALDATLLHVFSFLDTFQKLELFSAIKYANAVHAFGLKTESDFFKFMCHRACIERNLCEVQPDFLKALEVQNFQHLFCVLWTKYRDNWAISKPAALEEDEENEYFTDQLLSSPLVQNKDDASKSTAPGSSFTTSRNRRTFRGLTYKYVSEATAKQRDILAAMLLQNYAAFPENKEYFNRIKGASASDTRIKTYVRFRPENEYQKENEDPHLNTGVTIPMHQRVSLFLSKNPGKSKTAAQRHAIGVEKGGFFGAHKEGETDEFGNENFCMLGPAGKTVEILLPSENKNRKRDKNHIRNSTNADWADPDANKTEEQGRLIEGKIKNADVPVEISEKDANKPKKRNSADKSEKEKQLKANILSMSETSVFTLAPGVGAKKFNFDHVFNEKSGQNNVFASVFPLIFSFLNGENGCIFCFGQTGSGKTHTMFGESLERDATVWGGNDAVNPKNYNKVLYKSLVNNL